MYLLEAFLIFILAVVISSIIHNRLPHIPMAFIQIILGVGLFILPIPLHFEFDSEVFMMAVIAPLLFVEGTHVSRTKLLEYRKPIILMAMTLVFVTVIGVGFFIHWIWSDLPMPAAFAIAAILCPTDAVAVQAITKGKILPKGAMAILEGESLLNDAAGIISFKIAVTALVTGAFSTFNAISQFIISTIIGVLIGIIIGFIIVRLRVYLSANKGLKDSNTLIFIQLLTPFIVYFVAEELHASGIIAVVIAGLIHGFEHDRLIRAQTELQMSYNQIWDTLSYALNGFVFVVLGYIVPKVVTDIVQHEPENIQFLIITTLLIALAIYIFRYIWVFILFKDFYYPKNIQSYLDEESSTPPRRSHYALIMTMCGIHGTISLSMALTLPTTLAHHQNFTFKNDLLFIASLMVLISLVIAQIVLPIITPSEEKRVDASMSYQSAKIFIVERVILHFREKAKQHKDEDYNAIISSYFEELLFLLQIEPENKNAKEVKRLEELASEVETETLERLVEQDKINHSTLQHYRTAIENTTQYRESTYIQRLKLSIKMLALRYNAKRRTTSTQEIVEFKTRMKEVSKVMRIVHHNITLRLKEEQHNHNVLEVSIVLYEYYNRFNLLRRRNRRIHKESPSQTATQKKQGLYLQRAYLDELIEAGHVNKTIAAQVRENINYNEIVVASE
ncbi:sodium:proton antiporter [Staphylococcus sp. SQ8-PEA]|uniref:Sodium:proton antiporter n=1 Tax=Staphylococcus marylandisciuri TaxID=2981529 RepID=A0ABT2QMU6_9STAP|nr:sodium:proton antiporter [Staphylococcus marylandisciuri]MCU5745298.1 sodium:proton antiporter [Staphylococcus marylandisciuri]